MQELDRLLSVVIVSFLALVSGAVAHAEINYQTLLVSGTEYEDNWFVSNRENIESAAATLEGALSVEMSRSLWGASIVAGGDYRRFENELLPEVGQYYGTVQAYREREYGQSTVAMGYNRISSLFDSFDLAGDFSGEEQRDSRFAQLAHQQLLTEYSSVTVSLDGSQVRYVGDTSFERSDYNFVSATIGYDRVRSERIEYTLRVNGLRYETVGDPIFSNEVTSYGPGLQIRYAQSDRTRWVLDASMLRTESRQILFSTPLELATSDEFSGFLQLVHQRKIGTLELELAQRVQPGSNRGLRRRLDGVLKYFRPLSEHSRVSLSYRYFDDDGIATEETRIGQRVAISYTRVVSPKVEVFGELRYRFRGFDEEGSAESFGVEFGLRLNLGSALEG